MNVKGTKILRELTANTKPLVVLEGSSRSSKTYSIMQLLILKALDKKLIIRSFRQDATTCRKTLVPDFIEIMRCSFGPIWAAGSWNKVDAVFTYPNGSQHFFDGTQDVNKLHGLKQDIAHLNEVMEINYEAWCQIGPRTRDMVIMDFNPSLFHHWVFDKIMTRERSTYCYIHSTFKDNPFLTPQQTGEILAWEPTPENISRGTADPFKWQVYGLGKRGMREGVVFRNWEVTDSFPDRWNCKRWGFGMDFGFSADPSTLVECAVFQDCLYLSEWIYETGLVSNISQSNPTLPSLELRFLETQMDKQAKVYADSARPDLIAGLSGAGYNVIPTIKNKDSILDGIQRLQGIKIYIHRASQNIQREFESYTWKKERATGKQLDEPVDDFNHAIDAIRYWALAELTPRAERPRATQFEADSDYRYI